jgi:hypothetical protein
MCFPFAFDSFSRQVGRALRPGSMEI